MDKAVYRPFVEKRSAEVFSVGLQFCSPELVVGETVTNGAATVDPVESGGLTIDSVSFTDDTVSAQISDGIDGAEYQLTLTATTSAGHVLIGNILVRIIY